MTTTAFMVSIIGRDWGKSGMSADNSGNAAGANWPGRPSEYRPSPTTSPEGHGSAAFRPLQQYGDTLEAVGATFGHGRLYFGNLPPVKNRHHRYRHHRFGWSVI